MKRALLGALGLLAACSGDDVRSGGASSLPALDAGAAAPAEASSAEASSVEAASPQATLADAGAADARPEGDENAASVSNPCDDAGVPPSSLDCAGLYADFATKKLAPNALAYTPASALWSDGAQKQRWIELPAGSQIDVRNPSEWTFPVGTKLFKEFRVDGKRVETRLFQKKTSSFWVYATYAWNADDSAAPINYGGPVPVPVGDGGVTWNIPSNDDCNECHRGRQDRILGFEQVGLGLPAAQGLTLAELAATGLVTPAPAVTSLTIGDDGTGLDPLALGWIHTNCGVTCHNANPTAAGYGAGMLLRLDPAQLDGSPPDPATWDVLRTTLGVPCVSGGLTGQPRIAPGSPQGSAIYQLIDERGTLQMPPIASVQVDTADVAVVASWIRLLINDGGASPPEAGAPEGGGFSREAGVPEGGFRRGDGGSGEPPDSGPADGALPELDASLGLDATPPQDSGAAGASLDAATFADGAAASEASNAPDDAGAPLDTGIVIDEASDEDASDNAG